ncbi:MAG: SPOR domain-containing protein [Bacteroidota bacterium]
MSENTNRSGTIATVVILVVLLLGGAGGWYWFMYLPEQKAKEKARLEQIAKEKAEQKRKEEEAKKKAEYEKLIQDADAAFGQEQWELASSLYAQASSLYPNESYPKDQLVLTDTKLDEIAELEARRASGIVETVSSSTGRFYVVVSSSVDGDLAMDYASQLAKEGNYVKIVEPYASNKLFHRVTLGDYATWDEAVAATGSFSAYGNGVWVLKH